MPNKPKIDELEQMLNSESPEAVVVRPDGTIETELERKLSTLLNIESAENASNTPDWILAQFMLGCLASFNIAVQQRETWYGRDGRPTDK